LAARSNFGRSMSCRHRSRTTRRFLQGLILRLMKKRPRMTSCVAAFLWPNETKTNRSPTDCWLTVSHAIGPFQTDFGRSGSTIERPQRRKRAHKGANRGLAARRTLIAGRSRRDAGVMPSERLLPQSVISSSRAGAAASSLKIDRPAAVGRTAYRLRSGISQWEVQVNGPPPQKPRLYHRRKRPCRCGR
jgi:hypothetical protein